MWRLLLLLTACGRVAFDPRGDAGADARSADAPCVLGPWQNVTRLAAVNQPLVNDGGPAVTADLLSLVFHSDRSGNADLYEATRADPHADFGAPVLLPELNTTASEDSPALSPDGLTIYFESDRSGATRLYTATRASRTSAFGAPVLVPGLEALDAAAPTISSSGDELLFSDPSEVTITRALRTGATFAIDRTLDELDVNFVRGEVALSGDDLTVYLTSRPGGTFELYSATRPTVGAPFQAPQLITELSDPGEDVGPEPSKDGRFLFFSSSRGAGGGERDLFVASRACQ